MRLDAAELVKLEAELTAGRVPEGSLGLLREAVHHLLHCCFQSGRHAGGSERRFPRRRAGASRKGHGRLGAQDYPGAERIEVPHPELVPGDPCPRGCAAKVYDTNAPAVQVEMEAKAPVRARVYACQVLRCGSCQETFTAPLPSGARGVKYDPSVDAVVSVMRYALGVPHHRLAQWQGWSGVPFPASTQFERVEEMANAVLPAILELEKRAADSAVLSSDDTGQRILSLKAQNRTRGPDERTGVFTTGMVAQGLEGASPPIVLYASGRRHAGENVDLLLRRRTAPGEPVIHMADASSMAPRTKRLSAKCNAHARRHFIEASAAFPEQCEHVLDAYATIYRNDAATREMGADARLAYHQEHSGPVVRALYEWVEQQFRERLVEPNSPLGKAFSYLQNHKAGLTLFLEVPGVPLDNNHTERELKPSQRHRKNSLFFRNEAGAAVGDVLLSAIRTCVANRVDPVRYLTAVGRNAAAVRRQPEAWLPWNYPGSDPTLN